jgi:hypothetical protein
VARGRLVTTESPPRVIDPERPDVLDPRPLTEPVPLALCPNKPAPGCGWCWLCLMRAAGLEATDSLMDAALEVLRRPPTKRKRVK